MLLAKTKVSVLTLWMRSVTDHGSGAADSAGLAVGRVTWSRVVRLTFAFLFLLPSLGQAQMIRSYESLDRGAGDGYYPSAEFSFDGEVGNSDYADTELSGAVGYQGDLHWVRFYPTYRLRRSSGENVVHNRAAHFRHSFIISPRFRTFAFVQVQSEESIELERRFLVGGGGRYEVLNFGNGGMALGVGLMHDEEVRTGRDVRSDIRGANFLFPASYVGLG